MPQERDYKALAERRIRESLAVAQALLEDGALIRLVEATGREFAEALRGGHRLFFFGNGGSAADAQHLAAEIVGRYKLDRPGLPALALTVNSSSLTAIANDYSFDAVFARQIEALGAAGDVAVGISTSGNSANVLRAMEAAKAKRMMTVGMTGRSGGRLKALTDRCLCAPSDDTPRVQETHILMGHILCEIVEQEIYGVMSSA